jgi:hypothetical protein
MKKIILSLLFSIPALAQSGFSANSGTIVWERSFPAENANIVALLDSQPKLRVGTFMDNVYKGTGDQIKNTCASGSALMKNECKFDFIIVVNPDSYTVRVTNLKILEKFGPMQARVMANPCEKHFIYKSALKSDEKSKTDLSCLDNYLSTVFSMNSLTSSGALTSN